MNWLIILVIYVLKMCSDPDPIKVQKIFLLENNFWCNDQMNLKPDKGYLYRVNFDVKRENVFTNSFSCNVETCHPLKSTNLGYVVLRHWMIEEDITLFLNSFEVIKLLWRFCFIFADKPIYNSYDLENCSTKIQGYATWKFSEKISDNSISLNSDVTKEVLIKQIKKRFKGLIEMNPLKFNDYIEDLDEKKLPKIEYEANFDLYHFENYSECLKSLKSVTKDLCYFNLQEDGVFNPFTAFFSKMPIDKTTTLKVSQFKERICENFYEKLKRLYDIETDKDWKSILDECCECFKNEILDNKIFLPIGGKYNIGFYIEQLSNLIYESAKEEQLDVKSSSPNSENNDFICFEMNCSLKHGLKNLQLSAVQEFCESDYVLKRFSKLLGNKVKILRDFITIEKMVCDYYNMFMYIFNLYYELNKVSYLSYSYCSPTFIDEYNLKIIDGLRIEFKKPVRIVGFDDKEEEIIIMKDIDIFIDEFGMVCFPSEVLKRKNIQEIEIISSDDQENKKKFKVNDYLSL